MKILISNVRTKLALTAMTAVLFAIGIGGNAWAQTNPAAQTLPYSQDFSGLLPTSTTYPAGWQGWTLATAPSATFRLTAPTGNALLVASGTAGSTAGGIYNYNSQVGFLNTGSLDQGIVLSLNTQLRSGISVTYDIGTLRNPYDGTTNTRINEATLQYRVGTLGSFTALPATVNYSNNTVTQTAGTTLQNVVSKSITLPAACDNQNVVQIRWVAREVSGGGSRPSFAVDNISITSTTLSPLPDLLARWSLDGNINDSSGNGLASGTTTASPVFVTGIEGTQALGLNGTSQYATVPHDYRLNTPNQITLAAWIRPNAAVTQSVISKNINGASPAGIDGYELTLQTGPGGKPFVRFNQATSADTYRLNAATAYPTNGTTWMHVAATYDGTTARIYVNGVLDASAAMAVPSIATNANPLGIGSQYDGSGARFFNGAIDDARVYSRALSLSEVQALASHTLTYTAGANGSISGTNPQTVLHGGNGTAVTAVANVGYHFTSWSDGVLTASRTDTNVLANLSVTASFAINTYTLTYTAGANGSIVGTSPQTVPYGGNGTLVTATPAPGYHFVSWSDGYPTAARTDLNVTGDVTAAASFAINTYTLTYNAGPNGSIVGTSPQTVPSGGNGTLVTAVPGTGYHFTSWSDGVLTAARTDLNVTADVTVTASFAINTYTLTYTAGPNGSITGTSPQTVPYGGNGTLVTAVPGTGYHFVDWSDGVLTAARTDMNVTGDVTVTANFAINTYTLTYNAGPNGSIVGTNPQTVPYGGNGTQVTATPSAGYHFLSWSDAYATAARTDMNVTADLTVTANFEADAPTNTSVVNVGPAPGLITQGDPVRTVPVTISRTDLTALKAFSVVFSVSPPVNVNGGMAGIHQGTYLSNANSNTSFNLIDKGVDGFGNHSYQADGAILGSSPCGSTAASGTLFTIDLSSAAASGSGTVTITSIKLRDCSNIDLPWMIGTSSTVSIDQSAPSVSVTVPNGGELWHVGSSQNITWTGSDPEGVASYDLVYSTDGGVSYPNVIATVPGTSTSYAWTIPAAPGTLTRVRVTGHDVNGNTAADASNANFTIAYYSLAYIAGAGGTIVGTSPQSVPYGGNGTLVTATPNVGFHFVAWSDAYPTAARTDLNVTGDITATATFALNAYTLTYIAGAGGTIAGTNPQTVSHGANGTLVTATPNVGFHFVAWSDAYPTAARTDLNVTGDITATATFALNAYTLTYIAGAGGTIVGTNPQTVSHGANGTLVTATPNVGFHFVAWSDAYPTAARTDMNVTGDITATATFALNAYTLTYIAGAGGTIVGTNPQTVSHGANGTLVTATPNVGFHFVAWSDAYPTAARTDMNVTGDITATATFALNTYTLTTISDPAAGGAVNRDLPGPSYDHGTVVQLTAVPAVGYHFVSWSGGGTSGSGNPILVTMDSDKTVHAAFAINTYTLTTIVDPVGGGVINRDSPGPDYPHGTSVQITAVANPGYTFSHWTGDAVGTGNPNTVNMVANRTVTAHFTLNAYTLTTIVDPVGGGVINRNDPGPTYSFGTVVQLTAVANPGYTFANWSGDASGSGNPVSVTMDADKTVTGHFTLNTFTLTYTAGAGGTIAGTSPQTVPYGGNGTLVTATPNSGFHFVSWSDSYPTAARTDMNVTADINATATFAANPAVAAVANLAATQIRPGTLNQQTTPIQVSWNATPAGTTVEVWRKGFGSYPEYDDAGGVTPTASATYPPGAGWVQVVGLVSGGSDLVATRDFYFYVAYAQDGFGTWSPASSLTAGTLNYHLGDVSNGGTPGTGNNKVFTEDISLLGTNYGKTGTDVDPVNYLDVGPTTTLFVDGRPTTDNHIDFEDLVMFAINYGLGQTAPPATPLTAIRAATAATTVTADEASLEAPDHVTLGQTVTARLSMRGTGAVIAVSARLAWDPAVVEPVSHTIGDWLAKQDGQAFSAKPGTVDAAVMRTEGMTGEGELATVTFRVLSAGDPKLKIEALDARDAHNRGVGMMVTLRPLAPVIPATTSLAFARPNPFRSTVAIPFSLSARGPVALELYSVDGRRVRTLVNETREPGEYEVVWDGRDDNGNEARAGVYFVRLATPQGRFSRTITNLR